MAIWLTRHGNAVVGPNQSGRPGRGTWTRSPAYGPLSEPPSESQDRLPVKPDTTAVGGLGGWQSPAEGHV